MNIYLRLGGAVIIMAGSIYASYSYEKYINRRVAEYKGLLRLVSHAESRVSDFLSYGRGLWQGFSDDALEACGLLPALREGESLFAAFNSCNSKMNLTKGAVKEISERMKRLGRGYVNSELSALGDLRSYLEGENERERLAAEKNVRVIRALLLGGALTALILAI